MTRRVALILPLAAACCAAPAPEPSPIDYFGAAPPGDSAMVFAPGVVSLPGRDERCVAISPGGNEIFFNAYSDEPGPTLKRFERADGSWRETELPPAFADFEVGEPSFSPDGSRLYFSANPSGESGRNNRLWVAERTEEGWSSPRLLSDSVNFAPGLWHPSVARDGTLYFAHFDGTVGRIYRSEFSNGEYAAAVPLPAAVNTGEYVYDPFIDPDQRFLLFKSNAPGGFGGEHGMDMYVSFRTPDGGWTDLKNLGPRVNTAADDDAGDVTPDGRYLLYATHRNGAADRDIVWIDLQSVLDVGRSAGVGAAREVPRP